jgi:cytochrome c-type biogenesis protein CcsB
MKKILDLLLSSRATLLLLLIFTISIAVATFIEDKYDTITAKEYVFGAKWFELVLLLLVINFIGNIKKHNLFSREKAGGFILHISFIVMIIGAGITRYIGFEGMMNIREGESSNIIYSTQPYFQVEFEDQNQEFKYEIPKYISENKNNKFKLTIDSKEKGPVKISFKDYHAYTSERIVENQENGINILEIEVIVHNHKEIIFLKDGEIKNLYGHPVSFNNNHGGEESVNIIEKDGKLYVGAAFDIKSIKVPEMQLDTFKTGTLVEIQEKYWYEPAHEEGVTFKLSKLYLSAVKEYIKGTADQQGSPSVLVEVENGGKKHDVTIFGSPESITRFQDANIPGLSLKMKYGAKEIELPFSLKLDDFILDRYAGSMSPSSFESKVTLIDDRSGINEPRRIFMNNVLDYGGYRFFQSSYDQDEMGTILSVNHDFIGTWVSYFGYFLLGLGCVMVLFSKNSRFYALSQKIKEIQKARKATLTIAFMLFISGLAVAQPRPAATEEHAENLGKVLVQSFDGRTEPIHTLAYDVMHKIARKDVFDVPGKGNLNAMQIFLDIIIDPEFWKDYRVIYVKEKSVIDIIGIENKYASFNDFFDEDGNYKLIKYSEKAFRKKQGEQNVFDKEIIKVTERVEIFMNIFQGSLLKIFPRQNSTDSNWLTWNDSISSLPITGSLKILNDDLQLPVLNYTNIMGLYVHAVVNATTTGDYTKADKILGYIVNIQNHHAIKGQIPSTSMIEAEIQYNKAQIFTKLKNWYGLLGVILLVLAFVNDLRTNKSMILTILLGLFTALLAAAFLYHTYGMGMRWYLTGHAPWSNGYEALITIAWGGLLAGFCFIRYSRIALAATTLLAFFTLMTAGHSNYDPQLTNLQPVLKSYWLIIHVAALTISYGFLGLGFVVGLLNLILYLFKSGASQKRIDLLIRELTNINEMNLTIGLFLATIGTFLGGIWANESWGRYWGWDAKETWALVITIVYSIVLHLRLVNKLRGDYYFNVGSVLAFGSVLMTFFGVNYYLSKGLHSYASGDTPVFPMWAWISIILLVLLMIASGIKEKWAKK